MLIDHNAIVSAMQFTGPFDFAFVPIFFVVFGWIITFLVGLLFVIVAARFATRAVLDEIDKDRRRRGQI
jgi:hypothetical protein